MRSRTATFLTMFGLVCLACAGILFWQRITPQRLRFQVQQNSLIENAPFQRMPAKLIIPALKLELPISPADIRGTRWEASTTGVSHLATSPIPGEVGNSVLYGHNWPNLLGNLPKIKLGQRLGVIFQDGSEKEFTVILTQTVDPNQTGILSPTEDIRVTLYTCAGFLDRKRFVVTAVLR